MKKIFKILLAIIIVLCLISIAGIALFNSETNGYVTRAFSDLFHSKIETTNITVDDNDGNIDTETLAQLINSQLDEDELKAFNSIYDAICSYKSSIYVSTNLSSDRVFELVEMVTYQYPELFWFKGDCALTNSGRLNFTYIYTRDEAEEKNILIEERAREIFNEINPTGDEYQQSLAIYNYIISNTTYTYDKLDNLNDYPTISTIEGTFLDGEAICTGYAKAYDYLLSMAGIDAITVSGTAESDGKAEGHAWTAQRVNGKIYFTDTTWGDGFEKDGNVNFVDHSYFLITSEEIGKSHTCDEDYKIISATSTQDNYFIRENLYFTEYYQTEIKSIFKSAVDNEDKGVELKFADAQLLNEAKEILIDSENIYLILMSIDPFSVIIQNNAVAYNINENSNVITIFLKYN
jgi:hypothetical protein